MAKTKLGNAKPRLVGPYDGKNCEWCIAGDHGKCWRSVCHCKHEGWTRDPNAQGPHGLQLGSANYGAKDDEDDNPKRKQRRRNGFSLNRGVD